MGLPAKKVLCRVVFGGNGAAGSGATSKKPRRGERSGKSESIEPSLRAILTLANPLVCRVVSPAGMEPAGAERHRRSPAGVSFREIANQSNLRFALSLSWPTLWPFELCPRRESNPHLRFRKPLFFPLNYGDEQVEKEYTD